MECIIDSLPQININFFGEVMGGGRKKREKMDHVSFSNGSRVEFQKIPFDQHIQSVPMILIDVMFTKQQ